MSSPAIIRKSDAARLAEIARTQGVAVQYKADGKEIIFLPVDKASKYPSTIAEWEARRGTAGTSSGKKEAR